MKKDTPSPTPGVYRITNTADGKFYIGSSKNIRVRWNRHRLYLRKGLHPNHYLQNAWNLYGEVSFKLSVELHCDVSSLQKEEQKLLDIYWDNCKNCYNMSKDVVCPMRGKHHSEETKKRLAVTSTGKRHTEDELRKMSEAQLGSLNHQFGKRMPLEVRLKMSASHKGKKYNMTEEGLKVIRRRGEANPNFGRKASEELKKIMSERRRGENHSPKQLKFNWEIIRAIRYDFSVELHSKGTVGILADKYKTSPQHIRAILKNKIWVDEDYIPTIWERNKV